MGPLIPLFWTSCGVCPRVSKSGWIPNLAAPLPVHEGFLKFTSGMTPAGLLMASWLHFLHATYISSRGRIPGFDQETQYA